MSVRPGQSSLCLAVSAKFFSHQLTAQTPTKLAHSQQSRILSGNNCLIYLRKLMLCALQQEIKSTASTFVQSSLPTTQSTSATLSVIDEISN